MDITFVKDDKVYCAEDHPGVYIFVSYDKPVACQYCNRWYQRK